ncbi:MAG: helix-turn-helix transcriptional regulator [Blastocatellia bacterium]|nr:helix-turn-helix transcriptional regulator [Blastocatellia bacterium]
MSKNTQKPTSINQSSFGQRLAEARRAKGMTQEELAKKAGVHVSHVRRTETGVVQPSVEIVKRLAEALDVSTDLLIFDQLTEVATRRLSDLELIEQFVAIENFNDADKQAVKTLLNAMIIKQRMESAFKPLDRRAS